MYNSKLITLLSQLDAGERRRFRKWLRSPVHNANAILSKFYDFLDSRKVFSEITLQRERVFSYLYGNTTYDDLQIRRLMSEFLQTLEAFLVYENRREPPALAALSRARLYRRRQMPREAGIWVEEAFRQLKARPERDAHFFLDAYFIQEERLRQTSTRDAALNVQEMTDELCSFFAAEMLRNACTAASHQAIYRADYKMPYIEAILADYETGRYDGIPLIRLYYLCYQCLTQPEKAEAFYALKDMLPIAGRWLPLDELRNVTVVAINYCIRRLNTDAPVFMRDVFEIYQTGLEQGVFLEHGVLSHFTYKNIVSAALTLNETAWAETFIRQYAPLLPKVYRADYEKFCMAKLRYRQHDFASAQTLLHGVTFDDVLLDLAARVLLMKIYFENGEWRLLRGFLTAFERFVNRKKTLAYHAPNYLNIIHLTNRLVQYCSGQRIVTAEDLEALKTQIRSTQPLTERDWLEEMCAKMPDISQ